MWQTILGIVNEMKIFFMVSKYQKIPRKDNAVVDFFKMKNI